MAKKVLKGSPNQQLKAARELRGWSQKYVAGEIGADHYYLSRWERGTSIPSPYYRRKLCLLFGMDAKELGLLREETAAVDEKQEKQEIQETAAEEQTTSPARIYDPAIPLPFAGGYRLVGRNAILHQLKQRLFNSKNIVLTALNGIPGVGKTSLALALAYDDEVQDAFRDGILWAGLGLQPNLLSMLSHWGTLLGIAAAEIAKFSSIEDWTAAIHAAIGDRKLLLVIDDVWKLEDGLAFKVGGPRCAYVVTTRFPQLALQFAAEGATAVEELNEDDSMALLAQLAPAFVEQEPAEALSLVRAVGGLPLGLTLIGKYLRTQAYSGQLRRLRAALDKLHHAETRLHLTEPQALIERSPSLPMQTPISLQNLIEVSDLQLDEQARVAFRALAVFPAKPNTFSEEAALAVCHMPVEVLDTLSDVGLLEARGPERYALHQTIADYARAHQTDTSAYARMIAYYADYIEAHEKDYDALDQEIANIFAALQSGFEHGFRTDVVRGVNALMRFLDARGLYVQAEAYLRQAKDIAALLPERTHVVATLLHLGDVMVKQGEYAQGKTYLQEGLALARELDHREHMIDLLQSLGMLDHRQGNHQQSETSLQEGLTLARSVGDIARICLLLKNLGTLYATQGSYTPAEIYLQEGLSLAQQIGDREAMSVSLLNLGQLATEQGNTTQAEKYLQDALVLARQIGHREVISLLLTNMGVLVGEQEDYAQAERYFQEGLALARQIGFRERIGLLLVNLGWVATELEQYAQAEAYLRESVELANQLGNTWLICGALKFLGDLLVLQDRYKEAEATFYKVLEVAGERNQRMKGEALFGLAENLKKQGNFAGARKQAEASLAVFEPMNSYFTNIVRQWLDTLPANASA